MRQLKFLKTFHLAFFSSIVWLSISILCDHLHPRAPEGVSANSSEEEAQNIWTLRESNPRSALTRIASQEIAAPATLDLLPPGGISSGGVPSSAESQNPSSLGKGSAEDSAVPAAKGRFEGCTPSLPASGNSNENPVVPLGSSSNDQPEGRLGSSIGGSEPRTSANLGPPQTSVTSVTPLDAPGSQGLLPSEPTPSPQVSPVVKIDLPPANPASSSVTSQPPGTSSPASDISSPPLANQPPANVTSSSTPSNSSPGGPHKPLPPTEAEKASNTYAASGNHKTIVIAGCTVLGVLLMMGTALVLQWRKRTKNGLKPMGRGSHGSSTLQGRPGELGKRGTVLAGRGLESHHGLPSSGGWLDTRVASTERLVSVLSSRSSGVEEHHRAPVNPV